MTNLSQLRPRRQISRLRGGSPSIFISNILMEPSEGWIHFIVFITFPCLQGSDVDDEDMTELLNDTRILKKLKKGQISEEDFEKQITSGTKSKHKTEEPSLGGSGDEDV